MGHWRVSLGGSTVPLHSLEVSALALREERVPVNRGSAALPDPHSPLPTQSPVTSIPTAGRPTADTDARPRLESAQVGGCFATPEVGLRQSRRMEVFEHSSGERCLV